MHSEMQQHTLVFFGMPHRLGKPNNNNNNDDNTKNKMIFTQEAPLTRTRSCVRSNWNLEKLIMIIIKIIMVTIMIINNERYQEAV